MDVDCEYCGKKYIGKSAKHNLDKHLVHCPRNPLHEKYECKKCTKKFDDRHSLIGHLTYCGKEYKICNNCGGHYLKKTHSCQLKVKTCCKYCGKEYENGYKLGGHVKTCTLNPNRDETIRKISECKKNKFLSDETKNKISKSRIKYLLENPEKVPYVINHSSKMSYPEKIFKNALESSKIDGWIYNYRNGIYQYDFAFPDLKIDVEIDGATHNTEKVKKIDERRDIFSKDNGWVVIRFTAHQVKENVIKCVETLKKYLNHTH
jgi:5-methyltetrahydrofolate--homocysteine methyltransferase